MKNQIKGAAAVLAAAAALSFLQVQAMETEDTASAASSSFLEEQKENLRDALDLLDGMGISPMAVSEKLFSQETDAKESTEPAPSPGWEATPDGAGSTESGNIVSSLQQQAADIGDEITDTARNKVQSEAKNLGTRIRKSIEDAVVSWVHDLFN